MKRVQAGLGMFLFAMLHIPSTSAGATNPPLYSGAVTIPTCYNQTNGQLRVVKPWAPTSCDPSAQGYAPALDSNPLLPCSSGGSFDCKAHEYFVEISTVGPQGPQGPQGLPGPVGPQGPKGDKGDTGATGATGQGGPAGPAGAEGPAGPAGQAGAQGPQGVQGPVGPVGSPGNAGAAGVDGTNLTASVIDPLTDMRCGLLGGVGIAFRTERPRPSFAASRVRRVRLA